ncbi:MAG: adenylate/guanylate cyclase domain-containing protein [Alphaproteobacteria bacterium]
MDRPANRWRRHLFQKYFLVLFVAVVVPLIANGASEAWFGYRDQRATLNALLRTQAAAAASRIQAFLDIVADQLGWAVQLPWPVETDSARLLVLFGVLRQVPAVISVTVVDGDGRERLYVSRIELNRLANGADRSGDPAVSGAQSSGAWYGPVTYYQGSEPFMTVAVAGNRRAAGVAIAEINLKFIWEVVSAIRVGRTGHAFVLDRLGRLIAHPDISKVLSGAGDEMSSAIRKLRAATEGPSGDVIATVNDAGESVAVALAPIQGVDWMVVVAQPVSEAFAPIRLALWRTVGLMMAGAALAAALAYGLARRLTGPIKLLEEGTERIGAGEFDHRIHIATGDELERLADRFNRMACELAVSQERAERIARLKRFLAPQVAELVEKSGDEGILAVQRADVVVMFGDLRGFTAFAAHAEPGEIMRVLDEYHEALGSIITRFEATLTGFAGDGVMVLLNAPVPCRDPAHRAIEMALDMQKAVQGLIVGWRSRAHAIGFGVGLSMGPATVGRVGYESRVEYTAIGNVVNLASRLCSLAENDQILIDTAVAEAVQGKLPVVALGALPIKGYEDPLPVYRAEGRD